MGRACRFCWLIGLLASWWGCTESNEDLIREPHDVRRYASLPGLSGTHHDELRAEHARLISQRATPELLAARTGPSMVLAGMAAGPRYNATLELVAIFPMAELENLQKSLDRVYPAGEFVLTKQRLASAAKLSKQYQAQQDAWDTLLARTNLVFPVDHALGMVADTTFVDAWRAASQLDALKIADLIEHGQLAAAVDRLDKLFRGAHRLSQVDHLIPRIAAVHSRGELLEIVRAITRHAGADPEIYQRLLDVVSVPLRQWPADENAWIGERAAGLHTYELVRDGYLLSVLTYQELASYREGIGLAQLGQRVISNLDEDQLFYLTAMRQMISACRHPFYQRQIQFDQLRRDLERRRGQTSFPILADHLLRDLPGGQRLQALDRARTEAWRLALAAALQQPISPGVNPLTGQPYIVDGSPVRVIVAGIDPAENEPEIELQLSSAALESDRSTTAPIPVSLNRSRSRRTKTGAR